MQLLILLLLYAVVCANFCSRQGTTAPAQSGSIKALRASNIRRDAKVNPLHKVLADNIHSLIHCEDHLVTEGDQLCSVLLTQLRNLGLTLRSFQYDPNPKEGLPWLALAFVHLQGFDIGILKES
ncbi:hypothetical protein TURU_168377 [Turdus rufiventris]|nr:hypothetical protein TURU_168377 [Turdus rufiventris]